MTLRPDARALIDAAGDGDAPSQDDAVRVRAKLAARLAVGSAAGATATVATKSAIAGAGTAAGGATAGGIAGASFATKALVTIALLGATAATSAVMLRSDPQPATTQTATATTTASSTPSSHSKASAPALPASPETPAVTGPPAETTTAATVPAETGVRVATVPPAVPAATSRIVRPSPRPRGTTLAAANDEAPPAAAPSMSAPAETARHRPEDSIAQEAPLLRAANAALARGDGATALARLEEHAVRFPHGTLSEEREAARVFALCAGGRALEARAAAAAFVATNPRSPHAAQVRRSCAERTGSSTSTVPR
jgi:hypothetical protein